MSHLEQTRQLAWPYILTMQMIELTAKQVFSVRCPKCGAAALDCCVHYSGGAWSESHAERKFAALDVAERKSANCRFVGLSDTDSVRKMQVQFPRAGPAGHHA